MEEIRIEDATIARAIQEPRLRVSSPSITNMRQNKELLKKINTELIEKLHKFRARVILF